MHSPSATGKEVDMTMQAMTTMTLLGALNAGALKTGALNAVALQTALPVAGVASSNSKNHMPFSEMLANAGVPATSLVTTDKKSAQLIESPSLSDSPKTLAAQPNATTVEPTHGILMQGTQPQVTPPGVDEVVDAPHAAPLGPGTKIRMPQSAVAAREAEAPEPILALPVSSPAAGPSGVAAYAVVSSSPLPGATLEAPAPTIAAKPSAVVVTPEANAPTFAPVTPATAGAPNVPVFAGAPEARQIEVVEQAPAVGTVPEGPVVAAAAEMPVSATAPKAPAPVVGPNVPVPGVARNALALATAPEAPVRRSEATKADEVPDVKTTKATKGWKAHPSAVPTQEKAVPDSPALTTTGAVSVAVSVGAMAAPVSNEQPITHDTDEPVIASSTAAVPVKAVSPGRPNELLAAGPATDIPQEAPQTEKLAANIELAPQAAVVQQVQPLEVQATPALAAAVRAMQKLTPGESKPAAQKHVHGALTAIPSTAAQVVVAAPFATVVHPPSEGTHPSMQDPGIPVVVPHAVSVAVPVMETGRGVTAPGPLSANALPDAISTQATESLGVVPPALGHTMLNASPTMLEVGVPGGSHGWLKIRAEIGEGGSVQASLSATTPAGRETLHRELPEMTAFLASEQLSVQLHVAEPAQSSASSASVTHDFTQTSTPADHSGGERRERPYQEAVPSSSTLVDGPEMAWASSGYATSTTLHGGSWVNVVA
jgi:hypothetical protein